MSYAGLLAHLAEAAADGAGEPGAGATAAAVEPAPERAGVRRRRAEARRRGRSGAPQQLLRLCVRWRGGGGMLRRRCHRHRRRLRRGRDRELPRRGGAEDMQGLLLRHRDLLHRHRPLQLLLHCRRSDDLEKKISKERIKNKRLIDRLP